MAHREGRGFPRMIRGSVVVQRRRCGKPNCRCADGIALHESTALAYFRDGRNRTLMLAPAELARVRAAVSRYRAALAKVEADGDVGLSWLIARRSGR
jgi:hypothetical protein